VTARSLGTTLLVLGLLACSTASTPGSTDAAGGHPGAASGAGGTLGSGGSADQPRGGTSGSGGVIDGDDGLTCSSEVPRVEVQAVTGNFEPAKNRDVNVIQFHAAVEPGPECFGNASF